MSFSRQLLSFMLFTGLAACGGGSGSADLPNYEGTWDVRYNLTADECGIVLEGVPGFVDRHDIAQDGVEASFVAASGLIVADSAMVSEEGALNAEEHAAGDLYGDGSYCEMLVRVSYSNLQSDTAEALYFQSISCNDGFGCETRAIGSSRRQPG